jgi:hypothetical protein
MKKIYFILMVFILSISICNTYGQINNGLKAYYAFDGNVNDSSGENNNGSIVGSLTLISDRDGSPNCAYEFPGTSTDFISINYSEDFNISPTESFSLSLWFQGGTPNLGDLEFLFKKENPSITPVDSDYHLGLYDGNNPSFGSQYSPIVMSFTNRPNPDPIWHHIVCIYDNKNWHIYEDNILTSSNLTQNNQIYQSNNGITIGKLFQGKIDDIRFYDRVLTTSEIGQLFNFGSSCNVLSINDNNPKNNFAIFPNPANDIINIKSYHVEGEPYLIYIYDILGRLVIKKKTETEITTIDISKLNNGIYVVKSESGRNIQSSFLVKK